MNNLNPNVILSNSRSKNINNEKTINRLMKEKRLNKNKAYLREIASLDHTLCGQGR